MRQSAASAYASILDLPFVPVTAGRKIDNSVWLKDAEASLAPIALYNIACRLATRKEPELRSDPGLRASWEADLRTVRRSLELACVDPKLGEWAARDPNLRSLHKYGWFRELVGAAPRASYLEIKPFSDFAKKLKSVDLITPTRFLAIPSWRLRELTGVSELQITRLLRVARMAENTLDPPPYSDVAELGLEVLELLVDMGVQVPGDIRNTKAVRARLINAVESRCLRKVSDGAMESWLNHLARSDTRPTN